jgi:hypothetical protein
MTATQPKIKNQDVSVYSTRLIYNGIPWGIVNMAWVGRFAADLHIQNKMLSHILWIYACPVAPIEANHFLRSLSCIYVVTVLQSASLAISSLIRSYSSFWASLTSRVTAMCDTNPDSSRDEFDVLYFSINLKSKSIWHSYFSMTDLVLSDALDWFLFLPLKNHL